MKNSKTMAFGEVEFNTNYERGNWFARVKVRNLNEAKFVKTMMKSMFDEPVKFRVRGRGKWNERKSGLYYASEYFKMHPSKCVRPSDMPILLSDYLMVYVYDF